MRGSRLSTGWRPRPRAPPRACGPASTARSCRAKRSITAAARSECRARFPCSAWCTSATASCRGPHSFAAGGSAGGGHIADYISQGWIEILANGAAPAEAARRGHFSTAIPGKITVEKDTEAERLAEALRARGHAVTVGPLLSGQGYIERAGDGWIGAADPRRGGNAVGR
jgi:hypothetical protein